MSILTNVYPPQGNNTIWHYARDNERERNIEIWMTEWTERERLFNFDLPLIYFENSIDSKIHRVQWRLQNLLDKENQFS